MATPRIFNLGDVLSITTGRLVSSRHIEGVYDILNYLTGADLFTHQLPRASRECLPSVLAAYPHLSEEALAHALEDLDTRLAATTHEEAMAVCRAWVAELALIHGDAFPLVPLADAADAFATPVADLIEMVGAEKVMLAEKPAQQ